MSTPNDRFGPQIATIGTTSAHEPRQLENPTDAAWSRSGCFFVVVFQQSADPFFAENASSSQGWYLASMGLFAPALMAPPKAVSRKITARWEVDGALREPKTALAGPGNRIESS